METVRAKVSVLIHKAYHKDTERSLSITDQLIRWASPSYLISFPWNKGTRLRQPKMFSCAFEGSTFNPFPFPLSFSPKTAKELISLGNCQTQDLGRR